MHKQQGPCISVFMPAHRAAPENQQNPIRFKNLLGEAEPQLLASGLRTPEVEKRLKPAQELLNNRSFWQHQSDGLSVFISPQTSRYYRLPLEFDELVVVTNRFHIKPLLTLFSGNGRFYLLALSQNEIRLFQGTRFSISEVELEGVPESIDQALKYDHPEKQLQFHTRTPGGTGDRAAMFHGHGVGTDDAKQNIFRYFRQIDKGLHNLLKEEQAPLALAGVEYLLPIYRQANTYPYLAAEGITGNPDELSAKELHGRAWSVVQPLFLKAQDEAATRYKQLVGTGLASKDLKAIVSAAYHGRVESLFVPVRIQEWGTFDADANVVHLHQDAEPDDEDLLDLAAIQTLLHEGTVYAVKSEEVPDGAVLAAVFRY
jgi:hypothetical protein